MCESSNQPVLGKFEFGIVKRKARQLVGQAGFTQQDVADLEQELLAMVWQALKSYDPSLGHQKALVTAVVERGVVTLLRIARTKKRSRGAQQSLESVVDSGGELQAELSDAIALEDCNRRCDQRHRSSESTAELKLDLEALLESLPPNMQLLAEQLQEKSIAEIARESGVPRTSLNDRVRRLEQRFRSASMDDHL
jgi:RNA polymerase sigma-70 factor (ECF subfamily)